MSRAHETRNLPSRFAIMRPTSGGGPSYQFCTSRNDHIPSIRLGELDIYFQSIQNIQSDSLHTEYTVEHLPPEQNRAIYTISVRNANNPVTDVRKIKWSYVSQQLKAASGEVIPVVATSRRFFLTPRFHRIIPTNMTETELQNVYTEYDEVRQGFFPRPQPGDDTDDQDWRPVQQQQQQQRRAQGLAPDIPVFVRDLLVKSAIEKNESCAITLQPFSQLSSLGITPCFHLFDYVSIQRWIGEHHKCPTCRASLRTVHLYEPTAT